MARQRWAVAPSNPFVWTMVALCATFIAVQLVRGPLRMHDLEVDYRAASNFLHGQPVYFQLFALQSGYFKYSPLSLFFLVPLACLPLAVAKLAHFVVSVALLIVTTPVLERFLATAFFGGRQARSTAIQLISTLVVIVLYERELGLGNHTIMLLAMVVWSCTLMVSGRERTAGLVLGLAILLKPHFLVLTPLLVVRRRFAAVTTCAATLLGGVVVPTIALGPQRSLMLHREWGETMLRHNARVSADLNTLQAMLLRAVPVLHRFDVGIVFSLAVIALAAAGAWLFVRRNQGRERRLGDTREGRATQAFVLEYFVLLGLIPNLVVTDSEHFLWSLPIVTFLVGFLAYEHRGGWLLPAWCTAAFFLFGCDWYEVWGRTTSMWIEKSGALGLGNLLILLTAAGVFAAHAWTAPGALPVEAGRKTAAAVVLT